MNPSQRTLFAPSMSGGKNKNAPASAKVIGSASSGVLELFFFHPVDTTAKRLMSNTNSSLPLTKVIFKDAVNEGAVGKIKSLFPGLGFAAGYKILQRTYKFAAQGFLKDYLDQHYGDNFRSAFGPTTGKNLMHACAGSMVGIGEVGLLPLDVLKIKSQTNPEVLKGRGFMDLVVKENFALYRGWDWTMLRNAPGSFALFGGSAFMKGTVLGLEDYSKATFFQNFVSSIGGAIASITFSAPMDVIKTRIQNKPFDSPESGGQIIRKLLTQEGPQALFKGLVPKILVVGPKLVFSFTIAQSLISYLAERM